ncbi:T9SS type A sorting domain-containing protein, partial [candidate division WOR-3 bacterium]|nr:T9SS type A sorting domain-containing protein [candidate division WOR-3 bacterium]
ILRAGEPILVKCNNIKGSVEIKIIDAVGRKVRIDKITENTTLLKPLKRKGIYFIIFENDEYYCNKKIIIID